MNYILANELKDAGFPFKEKQIQGVISKETKAVSAQVLYSKDSYLFVPTLSELIEACGEEFGSLHSMTDGESDHKITSWKASNGGNPFRGNVKHFRGEGKTPEESVARLYLAIHTPTTTDSKDMID